MPTSMQTMRRLSWRLTLLTGLLAAFSLPALAQTRDEHERCDDAIVKIVGDHFKPDNFSPLSGEEVGDIVAGECKPWPTDKSRMIAAFAYDISKERGMNRLGEFLLALALVDLPNKRVIASYKESIQEDGGTEVRGSSLKLDTARYVLSETTRAFALRLNTDRYKCTHAGGGGDDLTLFVVSGKELRPVLSQAMRMWARRGNARNPCGGWDGYEEEIVEAITFIAVENTSTNGFADLRFSAKSDDNKKSPSVVVKYNGEHYDLAPWNKAFYSWWGAVFSP